MTRTQVSRQTCHLFRDFGVRFAFLLSLDLAWIHFLKWIQKPECEPFQPLAGTNHPCGNYFLKEQTVNHEYALSLRC